MVYLLKVNTTKVSSIKGQCTIKNYKLNVDFFVIVDLIIMLTYWYIDSYILLTFMAVDF